MLRKPSFAPRPLPVALAAGGSRAHFRGPANTTRFKPFSTSAAHRINYQVRENVDFNPQDAINMDATSKQASKVRNDPCNAPKPDLSWIGVSQKETAAKEENVLVDLSAHMALPSDIDFRDILHEKKRQNRRIAVEETAEQPVSQSKADLSKEMLQEAPDMTAIGVRPKDLLKPPKEMKPLPSDLPEMNVYYDRPSTIDIKSMPKKSTEASLADKQAARTAAPAAGERVFSHPKEMKDHLLEEWRDLKEDFGREGKTVGQGLREEARNLRKASRKGTRDLTSSASEIAKQTASDTRAAIAEASRRLRDQTVAPLQKEGISGIVDQVKKVSNQAVGSMKEMAKDARDFLVTDGRDIWREVASDTSNLKGDESKRGTTNAERALAIEAERLRASRTRREADEEQKARINVSSVQDEGAAAGNQAATTDALIEQQELRWAASRVK
jgi:hypothetical protein